MMDFLAIPVLVPVALQETGASIKHIIFGSTLDMAGIFQMQMMAYMKETATHICSLLLMIFLGMDSLGPPGTFKVIRTQPGTNGFTLETEHGQK